METEIFFWLSRLGAWKDTWCGRLVERGLLVHVRCCREHHVHAAANEEGTKRAVDEEGAKTHLYALTIPTFKSFDTFISFPLPLPLTKLYLVRQLSNLGSLVTIPSLFPRISAAPGTAAAMAASASTEKQAM